MLCPVDSYLKITTILYGTLTRFRVLGDWNTGAVYKFSFDSYDVFAYTNEIHPSRVYS